MSETSPQPITTAELSQNLTALSPGVTEYRFPYSGGVWKLRAVGASFDKLPAASLEMIGDYVGELATQKGRE